MSGCKNPCKALAKIEYENRYRKNSKPKKFWGKHESLSPRARQQFLQLRQSDVVFLSPEGAMIFLVHSRSCGPLVCRAPGAMLRGRGGDGLPAALPQLETPFASPGQGTGDRAGH